MAFCMINNYMNRHKNTAVSESVVDHLSSNRHSTKPRQEKFSSSPHKDFYSLTGKIKVRARSQMIQNELPKKTQTIASAKTFPFVFDQTIVLRNSVIC